MTKLAKYRKELEERLEGLNSQISGFDEGGSSGTADYHAGKEDMLKIIIEEIKILEKAK